MAPLRSRFSATDDMILTTGKTLVRKIIRALDDIPGSRKSHRNLTSALVGLEEVLNDISNLKLTQAEETEGLALINIATQAQASIETFLRRHARSDESARVRPTSISTRWRDLDRIRWALLTDTAIEDLQAQVSGYTTALDVTLTTLQFSALDMNVLGVDDDLPALSTSASNGTTAANTPAEQDSEDFTSAIETITRAAASLAPGTQAREDEIVRLVREGLQQPVGMADALAQIHEYLNSIQPQSGEHQQPALAQDVHQMLLPLYTELLHSCEDFQTLMNMHPPVETPAPKNAPVQSSEPAAAVQDTPRGLAAPFIFHGAEPPTRRHVVQRGSHVQWNNPSLGWWYNSQPCPRKRMKIRAE